MLGRRGLQQIDAVACLAGMARIATATLASSTMTVAEGTHHDVRDGQLLGMPVDKLVIYAHLSPFGPGPLIARAEVLLRRHI